MVRAFASVLVGLVLGISCGATSALADVIVSVGGQHLLNYRRAIERVSIGSPETADVTVTSPNEVLITGKAVGRTQVIVWTDDGRQWSDDVVVRIDLQDLKAALAEDDALRHVELRHAGEGVRLLGVIPTLEAHERLVALTRKMVGSANFVDDTRVASEHLVMVEVKVAAVSTSTLKRLGFNFSYLSSGFQLAIAGPNSVQGFNIGGSGIDLGKRVPPIADAFNLFLSLPNVDLTSVLGALSSYQLAQVLAEPNLTLRSGSTAEFLVGGDLPIPVPQRDNVVGIEFRTFGIRLSVGAKVLSSERILLELSPEISEPDFTRGVTIGGVQVPSINRRAAKTTVELGDGQSIVLAGLISQSSSNVDSGAPGFADIPVIGHFFGRRSEDRQRQELIIVATPRLVAPLETERLPSLPGEPLATYRRTDQDLLLNRRPVRGAMVRYGLLP